MESMTSNTIIKHFGDKLRVRVMGILVQDEKLLLIKHSGLGAAGYLWSPPGGGMEYGFSAGENLKREFLEETGLQVEVKEFLFICELLKPPFHAIELFYSVTAVGGVLMQGKDPEMSDEDQIIKEVRYMTLEEIIKLPQQTLHKSFHAIKSFDEILEREGYFMI